MIEETKDKLNSEQDDTIENPIEDTEELENDDMTYDYSAFDEKEDKNKVANDNASQKETQENLKETSNLQEGFKNIQLIIKSDDSTSILVICAAVVFFVSSIIGLSTAAPTEAKLGFRLGIFFGFLLLVLTGLHYYASRNEGTLQPQQSFFVLLGSSGLWSLETFWLTNDDEYFGITSNGYFALWIGALLSYKLLLTSTGFLAPLLSQLKLVGWQLSVLVLSSGMLFSTSLLTLFKSEGNKGIFALVVGAFSAAVSVGTFFGISKLSQRARIIIFATLSVLWLAAVCLLTTPNQHFAETGNGYFACWGGLISSLILLSQVLNLNSQTGILHSSTANNQNFV